MFRDYSSQNYGSASDCAVHQVVGRPSGVTCSATARSTVPLVVVSDFSEGVQRDLQAQLAPSMLGEDAAMLVYGEKNCGEGCVRPFTAAGQLARSVRAAHAAAVAGGVVELARRAGREAYSDTRLGCIDGLEDYRLALQLIRCQLPKTAVSDADAATFAKMYNNIRLPPGRRQHCALRGFSGVPCKIRPRED